ncbi:hypothetical protein AUI06_10130 [archaeon 13_2_20CM_2_52_21]|nr:MAG: hypothetical protein AUI06_10130 [archaeon 13_2_20CM_2_52_21]
MPGKTGPDNSQLKDLIEHSQKVLATLAPHLVLYMDLIRSEGYGTYKDFDSLPVEYGHSVQNPPLQYHFLVTRNPNSAVERVFHEKRFGELVSETGLSKVTVSKILSLLIEETIVVTKGNVYMVNPFHFGL